MSLRQHLGDVTPAGTTLTTSNLLAVDGSAASIVSPGAGGTIQSSVTQVHAGPTSIRVVGGGSTGAVIRLPFAGTASNAAALCLYHYGLALAAVDIVNVRHSAGQLFRIGLSGTGAVQIKNSSGTTLGSTSPAAAWQPNRWNRIEARWNNAGGTSAGTVTIECYVGDSLTPTGTLSLSGVNLGSATTASIEIGTPNAPSSTATNYFDSIQMDDGRTTFIGPYLVAPAAPVVNALSPLNIGPGQQKNIVASLASGSADSWTWRQVSGPTTAMNAVGNTLTITGPSVLPPANGTAVFGVKAVDDGVESTEVTATATITPQRNWTRVPGGNWVGSKVVSV